MRRRGSNGKIIWRKLINSIIKFIDRKTQKKHILRCWITQQQQHYYDILTVNAIVLHIFLYYVLIRYKSKADFYEKQREYFHKIKIKENRNSISKEKKKKKWLTLKIWNKQWLIYTINENQKDKSQSWKIFSYVSVDNFDFFFHESHESIGFSRLAFKMMKKQ